MLYVISEGYGRGSNPCGKLEYVEGYWNALVNAFTRMSQHWNNGLEVVHVRTPNSIHGDHEQVPDWTIHIERAPARRFRVSKWASCPNCNESRTENLSYAEDHCHHIECHTCGHDYWLVPEA